MATRFVGPFRRHSKPGGLSGVERTSRKGREYVHTGRRSAGQSYNFYMSIRVSRVHDPIRADSHIIIQEKKAGVLKTPGILASRPWWAAGLVALLLWTNGHSSPKMNSSFQTGDLCVILGVHVGKDGIFPLGESISDEREDWRGADNIRVALLSVCRLPS